MPTKTCTLCKEIKDDSCFNKHSWKKNGLQSICRQCAGKISKKSKADKKIRHIENMGGKCNKCGITLSETHPSIFDFHHLDPTLKEVSWTILRGWNESKVKQELSKCILLCANCHRIVHYSDKE